MSWKPKKHTFKVALSLWAASSAHSSQAKAAKILGLRYRSINTNMADNLDLLGKSLHSALEDCESDGLYSSPFLTTTLGTTATCATDRFEEVKETLKLHPELWVHVDAAYADAALVCEEYQHLTQPFDAFDSFDVNMHKWLLRDFDVR